MSHQELTVDVFFERIVGMPDIEARHEIDLRLEHHALEYAVLANALSALVGKQGGKFKAERERIGLAMQAMGNDRSRLNKARQIINDRMDRCRWDRAVRAIYGVEGYEACRAWMAAQEVGAHEQHAYPSRAPLPTAREGTAMFRM